MKNTENIKRDRDIERQKLIADITHKAAISRKFINDKRHKDYKSLLETAIAYKRDSYEGLADSVKDNDELIRKSLIICTEIRTLQWILNTPEKFIDMENKLKEQEKYNDKL